MATATKLHSVVPRTPEARYYDVLFHKGPYNFPTKREDIVVSKHYTGGGIWNITVTVKCPDQNSQRHSTRRLDAIARRVSKAARLRKAFWDMDEVFGPRYIRIYLSEGLTD